jgi:hypothetical protein
MGTDRRQDAAEYRRKANLCFEIARQMSLQKDRHLMLEMAQHWLDMARRAEAAGE